MEYDLKNKTAVVTGGAEGIGYSIAEKFIEQSAKVIIVDINEDKGKEAANNLKNETIFIKFDLTTDPEVLFDDIIEKYKQIDVLVNSAGVGSDHPWKNQISVNLTAGVSLSLRFYEHMSNRGGVIINISSLLGIEVAPFASVYQATKSGIISFSRSLGHEENYKKSGVKVIALCPGFTKTNMTKLIYEGNSSVQDDLVAFGKCSVWQDASSVGDAAVETCKTAPSGTVWSIMGGKLELTFQH